MRTLVVRVTVMFALMEPTTDAEEIARCTLNAAELDIRPQFDNHDLKSPTQILYGCIARFKPPQIAIQPRLHVIDTQLDRCVDV
jgi:hypothetical protein